MGVAQIWASREPQGTLLLIEEAVSAASAAGADLVVFPEAAMCSFLRDPQEVAEPLDGPWATRVSQLARGAGVIVVAGMFTVADDGVAHTTPCWWPVRKRCVTTRSICSTLLDSASLIGLRRVNDW